MVSKEMRIRADSWRVWMGLWGILAIITLVYGSLVPLTYRPLDWSETIDRWLSIPWYHLGVYHRADWIANGLLVVPIPFFLTGAFTYGTEPRRLTSWLIEVFGMLLVLAFVFALVFGIELVQVWFPPRTVSWNDIVSGWIGAVVGAFLWICFGRRLVLAADWFLGIKRFEDRLRACAILGCIACLFYSTYPFDIVVSVGEWSEKISRGQLNWGFPSRSISKQEWLKGFTVSALRMVPVGLLGLSIKDGRIRWAWILGMGIFMELVQLPIYSKFSSVSDVLAGWIGGVLGFWMVQPNRFWTWLLQTRWVWICAAICWSGLLLTAFLGRSRAWVTDPIVLNERWSGFLAFPFLRYYYTSEYSALTNLLGKLLSFSLLGSLVSGCLIFGESSWTKKPYQSCIWLTLVLSVSIGLIIEIAQIYLEPFVGDLTDVGVYATGASAGAWLMVFLVKGLGENEDFSQEQSILHEQEDSPKILQRTLSPAPFATALGVGSLGCGGVVASVHPGWPWFQFFLFAFVSFVVYRMPNAFVFFFVLALVVADAYPVTGQLVVQEYDSLLLGAFAGFCFAHGRSRVIGFGMNSWATLKDGLYSDGLLFVGLSLLSLSAGISLIVGILRLPSAPWGDQLSVYFTQWNAIRVGKGIFWGLVFVTAMIMGRLQGLRSARTQWILPFLRGFSLAGFYVGGFVVLERVLFPGLLNWSDVYRATGPFFTMHIGDQHLDAFLVMSFPWVWSNMMQRDCTGLERCLCAVVLTFLAYAAFSTMSRATLAVILLQIALLVTLTWLRSSWDSNRIRAGFLAGGLGLFLLIGIWMAMQTQAIHGRFLSVAQDWNSRVKHWSMILSRGTSGIGGLSIGHGLGTLPSLVAAEFGRPVPPLSWRRVEEEDSMRGEIVFLGQWPIYLERWVSKDKLEETLNELKLQVKQNNTQGFRGKDAIQVQPILVEKSVLESYDGVRLPAAEVIKTWTPLEWNQGLDLKAVATSKGDSVTNWRPWTLGLFVAGDGGVVIRSDQVLGRSAVNSTSSYPWFFTCDDHMVWRAQNFLVHAYYEQGLAGVLSWLTLILVCLWRGFRSNSILGSSQAVSIIGFVGVGFFGTLIDTPWITALLLCILAVPSFEDRAPRHLDANG